MPDNDSRDQIVALILDTREQGMSPAEAADHLLAAGVRPRRRRIAEPEATQPDPAGYLVGCQHDGAPLLEFEAVHVDPFGDRARAYATRGEAQAFADKCGRYNPRTVFKVYALQEMSADA
ncbi:hypothetical protein B7C42_01616 [Nocardia cerradoensis]|uniref:Uncharacterized protein n=1 Tax=Nocardia cerradoensis TaxID=85688 RepID=A0A231HCW7_9NOCA|nr:hypothetical protein [Nocardia cerradoensis]OXR46642.1 hypothetical protein B7C42_01616 [Nocardia cerradoensis]